jgi:hypothetical protein
VEKLEGLPLECETFFRVLVNSFLADFSQLDGHLIGAMLPKIWPEFGGDAAALLAAVAEVVGAVDIFWEVCALVAAFVRSYPAEMEADDTFRRIFHGLLGAIQTGEWLPGVSKGPFFEIVGEMHGCFQTFFPEWADLCLKPALVMFTPDGDMEMLWAIASVFVKMVDVLPQEVRASFMAAAQEIYSLRQDIFECSDALPDFVQKLGQFEIAQS